MRVFFVFTYLLTSICIVVLTLILGEYSWREWYRFAPILFGVSLFYFFCSFLIYKSKLKKINLVLCLTIIGIFVVVDRFIWLNAIESNVWMFDSVLHYKHRPNSGAFWTSNKGAPRIRINRYGHNDDDFPQIKRTGEIRGLMLGDSITMGHGVDYQSTFSNILERIIESKYDSRGPSQVINTGVQGYSSFQELEVFTQSLVFEPDFVVLGFCMNDVTEPYKINTEKGGEGWDYHRVEQNNNPTIGWLLNETGYGKYFKSMKSTFKLFRVPVTKEQIIRRAKYNDRYMMENPDDPNIQQAWSDVSGDITKMASIANDNSIPMLLVVFPHKFQLHKPELQNPSYRLKVIAERTGIDFLDFTEIWEQEINSKGETKKYFLDYDHYTEEGHKKIADYLFDWIQIKGIVSS